MKLILDPGSCHMGRIDRAKELIDTAVNASADAVKFQLLQPEQLVNGNIQLPWKFIPELIEYGDKKGIEVFASVFDTDGVKRLKEWGCKSIKFSYSQKGHYLRGYDEGFKKIYVSCDVMSEPAKIDLPGLIKLYCISQYPVQSKLDFEGIFPRFDGFSSHTLGIKQDIAAKEAGAKILEKHFTLARDDIKCPDHNFALKPRELFQLAEQLKAPKRVENQRRSTGGL